MAKIHFANLECEGVGEISECLAGYTDGFSSREIAEQLCPSIARLSNQKPTAEIIARMVKTVTPASKTQAQQLAQMRAAASTLRRANDPEEAPVLGQRRVVA